MNNSKHQSFLATSSRKYFKYGLGTSLLLAIIAFNIPIYSNIPKTVYIAEEEFIEIDYLTTIVPEKKIEKKVEEKIKPKALPTIATPEPIEPKPMDPEPIKPVAPITANPVFVDPAPVISPVKKDLDFAEIMPAFRGGESALFAYFAKEIDYPWKAVEWQISGKVYVRFVVDEEGNVVNASVAKGIHPLLDEEALRVVKAMPSWDPGMQNGKKVRVSMVVPVNFVLQ